MTESIAQSRTQMEMFAANPVKRCRRCQTVKPTDEFYKNRQLKGGLHSYCRVCTDALSKKYYDTHRTTKLRDVQLKRSYGMSLEERDRRAAQQDHLCAICGQHESKMPRRRLAIDHDHASGAIRELLCDSCNNGLGRFRDRPELLEAAAAYLRRHAALEVPHADQVAVGR